MLEFIETTLAIALAIATSPYTSRSRSVLLTKAFDDFFPL
jgi:hypothetical protein